MIVVAVQGPHLFSLGLVGRRTTAAITLLRTSRRLTDDQALSSGANASEIKGVRNNKRVSLFDTWTDGMDSLHCGSIPLDCMVIRRTDRIFTERGVS